MNYEWFFLFVKKCRRFRLFCFGLDNKLTWICVFCRYDCTWNCVCQTRIAIFIIFPKLRLFHANAFLFNVLLFEIGFGFSFLRILILKISWVKGKIIFVFLLFTYSVTLLFPHIEIIIGFASFMLFFGLPVRVALIYCFANIYSDEIPFYIEILPILLNLIELHKFNTP